MSLVSDLSFAFPGFGSAIPFGNFGSEASSFGFDFASSGRGTLNSGFVVVFSDSGSAGFFEDFCSVSLVSNLSFAFPGFGSAIPFGIFGSEASGFGFDFDFGFAISGRGTLNFGFAFVPGFDHPCSSLSLSAAFRPP